MAQDAGDEAGRTTSRALIDIGRSVLRVATSMLARKVVEPAVGALGSTAVSGTRGAIRMVRRYVDPHDPTNTVDTVEAMPKDNPTKTVLVQHFSRRDVRDQFVELMRAEGLDVEAAEEPIEGKWIAVMAYETKDERCAQAIGGIDGFILQSLRMVEADSTVDYVDEGPLATVEWAAREPVPETTGVMGPAGYDAESLIRDVHAVQGAGLELASDMLPEPEEVR